MMDDDASPVQEALEKMQSRQLLDREIKASLSTGARWPLCWKKHQEARQQLYERFGVQAAYMKLKSYIINAGWLLVSAGVRSTVYSLQSRDVCLESRVSSLVCWTLQFDTV